MTQQAPTASPAPAFDWGALPDAVEAPQVYAPSRKIDVERDIPAALRARVEESLKGLTTKTVKTRGGGSKVVPVPDWKIQCGLPSEEVANDFMKLVKKYGQNRPDSLGGQITVRATLFKGNAAVKLKDGEYAVRFVAKPLERKGETSRLPGSAK